MGDNCCLCIPLEAGANLIGILTILFTIALAIFSYFDNAFFHLMWPLVFCYIIMSIVWAIDFLGKGFKTIVAHCWVVLMVFLAGIYYASTIIDGRAI